MSAENICIFMGRATKDPEVRYGENNSVVARYSLAVNRSFHRDNEPSADFLNLVAFGNIAEFTEKYVKKGTKLLVRCHVQTGSYTNKDGQKVYTTDFVVDEQTFAESKASANANIQGANDGISQIGMPVTTDMPSPSGSQGNLGDFMNIPDNIGEELPFV